MVFDKGNPVFIEITGDGYWREVYDSESTHKDETASFISKYKFHCMGPFISDDILFKDATYNMSSEDAKDNGYWYEDSPKTHNWPSGYQNYKESMTQTITFKEKTN